MSRAQAAGFTHRRGGTMVLEMSGDLYNPRRFRPGSLLEHAARRDKQNSAGSRQIFDFLIESRPARQHPQRFAPHRKLGGLPLQAGEHSHIDGSGTPLALPDYRRRAAPKTHEIDLVLAIPPASELAELGVDVVRSEPAPQMLEA